MSILMAILTRILLQKRVLREICVKNGVFNFAGQGLDLS